jgi:phosphoglycolate phosphatase
LSPKGELAGATLVFDLDGTLVDTAPDLVGTLNQILVEHDLPAVPLGSARRLVGGGARRMLEHGFREAGATFNADAAPEMVERFFDLYLERIAAESQPFPGVVEALDGLKAEGAKLVVCTNKRTSLAEALLRELALIERFDVVAGPDTVSACKPHPTHLIEAIRMGGGDLRRAVMVGDSDADARSAQAAGVPIVLVSYGYTEVPVETLGGDAIIDHFGALGPVVNRLLGRASSLMDGRRPLG